MCRIIFLRHGEQPNFVEAGQKVLPNLKSEASEIGLTIQGSIRACFMPKLIKKILGKKGHTSFTLIPIVNMVFPSLGPTKQLNC